MLLWLWHRPAAGALIQPLAQELLYATGTALKQTKERKKEGRKEGNNNRYSSAVLVRQQKIRHEENSPARLRTSCEATGTSYNLFELQFPRVDNEEFGVM